MEIFGIGPMELILVLIIALMVFGPDKLPEMGAKLGKAMRGMREATHEFSQEIEDARQALEAPVSDIKAPFQEATAAVQAISHPQTALRDALLGEVNRADDAARETSPVDAQAGGAAATGAALAGAAVTTPDDGQLVTENPADSGARQADQSAFVQDADHPERATVAAEGGDQRAESSLALSDAEALPPANGHAGVSEAIPATTSTDLPAPGPIQASAAASPVELGQPATTAAADTAFDMEEFVAVMERVSRRLSPADGKTNKPAEPAAWVPTSGTSEPEDPQSPANPAVEE